MTDTVTKKQQIYAAAARLFRDRGYPATSMRHLAEAVDLKASSLYNHIGSKEDILREICFENARKYLSNLNAVAESADSGLDKIKTLIDLHLTMAAEDVTSVIAFNDEWRHLSEPWLSDFIQLRKDYEKGFLKIIEAGIAAGLSRCYFFSPQLSDTQRKFIAESTTTEVIHLTQLQALKP